MRTPSIISVKWFDPRFMATRPVLKVQVFLGERRSARMFSDLKSYIIYTFIQPTKCFPLDDVYSAVHLWSVCFRSSN